MRLNFLTLPAEERRLYIEQSAIRRNVSPVLLEKDFWVCWLLGLLYGSEFAGSLVFKGGTSLSKVFGVIERFSEDIDLSLAPEFLKLPEEETSRNQANKWMTKAEAACARAVKTQIAHPEYLPHPRKANPRDVVRVSPRYNGSRWYRPLAGIFAPAGPC